ncbi:MAG: serine/threonine protein kinase [Gammaproteobacteria bacterium]|nr:serine/threonine protein kinase [Gammaproteobacteria bacterium]
MSLPAHERSAWVESLPAAQHALREPLRRLLEVQAGIETRHFIDGALTAAEVLTPPAAVLIGDLVGPYRLLQQIGDGGMGSVWLAERTDGTIKRKIALNLPRMVWARDLASRMARERDILGSLEHPNIARLYDASVDQLGRPFLALEYVEGQRLDHYCDEHRLTVDGRIRLFLQVLDAVQYAHTNLVLHRDLKPGNILVNQRAEIRLLDFGIAKLMGDDTVSSPADALSRSLSRAMTPRYASPEQVQQTRLTLASDVYSLGVMLYELLVGSTPFITQNGSRAELEMAITEGHLRTPSRAKIDPGTADVCQSTPRRLLRILRGELDAVLLKALARNATDRYPSAEVLRADLVRWLEGHPVRAKPPSRLLAIRKFIACNAWTVGIGTTAVTAVTVAAVIAVLQARETRIESRRATATRDFLIGLFENANPELHGRRDIPAKQLLLSGESVLDAAPDFDYRVKADIYSAIATVWSQIGDREKTKKTSAKRVALLERDGPSRALLTALFDFVEACMQTGEHAIAAIYLGRIAELSMKLPLLKQQRAEYDWYRGWIALRNSDFDRAEEGFSSSLDSLRETKDAVRELRALSGRIQSRLGMVTSPRYFI